MDKISTSLSEVPVFPPWLTSCKIVKKMRRIVSPDYKLVNRITGKPAMVRTVPEQEVDLSIQEVDVTTVNQLEHGKPDLSIQEVQRPIFYVNNSTRSNGDRTPTGMSKPPGSSIPRRQLSDQSVNSHNDRARDRVNGRPRELTEVNNHQVNTTAKLRNQQANHKSNSETEEKHVQNNTHSAEGNSKHLAKETHVIPRPPNKVIRSKAHQKSGGGTTEYVMDAILIGSFVNLIWWFM